MADDPQRGARRPKFTVMMPLHERILGLDEAVASVLEQTCDDFELVLADDGSRSPEIDRRIAAWQSDPRVLALRLPHGGPGAALNAAARVARGRYLCRLDSDDLIVPEALATLDRYTDRYPSVGYFYSSRYVIDERGEILESHHKSRPFDPALLVERYMANPLLCWRRDEFLAIGGFREEVRFAEDYDLALRMATRFEFQNVDEFLYKVRYHDAGRITTTLSEQEQHASEAEVRATSGALLRRVLATRPTGSA
jgi:glycosyltransferase involved in cell wall biosynthesis